MGYHGGMIDVEVLFLDVDAKYIRQESDNSDKWQFQIMRLGSNSPYGIPQSDQNVTLHCNQINFNSARHQIE